MEDNQNNKNFFKIRIKSQVTFLLLIISFLQSLTTVHGTCKLPDSFKGKWFQSGIPQLISIDGRSIESKGVCYENTGDKYLFVDKSPHDNCHRCLVINSPHKNVLQYKESLFCEAKDSLEKLCSQIGGDEQLYTMFKVDAQPEECPFKGGPFTFTYNKNFGLCSSPVSHVDTCTENSHLLFRYQACPNVQKTESISEELECLGNWRDGSHNYLIGKLQNSLRASNEEKYRCFIYERIKGGQHGHHSNGHGGHLGYKIAQSGDASCTGITSPTEGARTLTLTRTSAFPEDPHNIDEDHPSRTRCKFPHWLSSHHWHSLDGKMSVKVHHNTSIHFNEEEMMGSSGQSSTSGLSNLISNNNLLGDVLFKGGTRIYCQNRYDLSDKLTTITAHLNIKCKHKQVCIQIYKRDRHVVEMQLFSKENVDGDCSSIAKDKIRSTGIYHTLISSHANTHRCPYLGRFTVESIINLNQDPRRSTAQQQQQQMPNDPTNSNDCPSQNGGGNLLSNSVVNGASFNTLVVGCGDRATMNFYSKCSPQHPINSFSCHGSWEENGIGYLVASPQSRSSTSAKRYCFIYKQTENVLRVSSSSESCQRQLQPGFQGNWAFNLTLEGQCAEANSGNINSLTTPLWMTSIFSTILALSAILRRIINLDFLL